MLKIVGLEVLFLVLTNLINAVTKGGVAAVFNLLFLVGGFVLWAVLLKKFAASRYSIGKAIGSYLTNYLLALVLSLVVAITCLALFAQVFKIDGDSMAPDLPANQTVLVYKFEKHPKKNDVIVYKNHQTGKRALGRVQGIPNQRKLGPTEYYVTTDNPAYNIAPRIIDSSDIIGTVGPKL